MLIATIIAMVFLCKKLGLPGWTFLIPFYNSWKIGQRTAASKAVVICSIVFPLISSLVSCILLMPLYQEAFEAYAAGYTSIDYVFSTTELSTTELIGLGIVGILGLCTFIFEIILSINRAHSLGKGTGLALVYTFIPIVNIILFWVWTFGSSTQYVGPNGDPGLIGEPWRKIDNMQPPMGGGYPPQGGYGQPGMPPRGYGRPQGYGQPQGGYGQQQGGYPPQQGGWR